MKVILYLTFLIFTCSISTSIAQDFISSTDLHDLSGLQQQFIKDPTKLLKNNKYALLDEDNKVYLCLVAKTKNGFSPKQIESFGGRAHVTINGLAHLRLPISKINKLKELENIEFASLSRKLKRQTANTKIMQKHMHDALGWATYNTCIARLELPYSLIMALKWHYVGLI